MSQKIKKIGVLTILPHNKNFGGILQGFALMQYLKSLGHDVYLINRVRNKPSFKSKLKNALLNLFSNSNRLDIEDNIISKNLLYFENKYIQPRTSIIDSQKSFSCIQKYNFDSIIVGSDQIWRKAYNDDRKSNFFLDFIVNKQIKRISYAASFGVDTWDYSESETKLYANLLQKFDAVSVRETSGQELCKKYLEVEATQVIDPTLLINKEEYIRIIENERENNSNGDLLYYLLGETEDKLNVVNSVKNTLYLTPFSITRKTNNVSASIEDRTFPSVTAWLKGFHDAKFVVTDSFHGCVFSILFNKPFIAYGNKSAGLARFESLLKMFHLEDRLILDKNGLTESKINSIIDWDTVNLILDNRRIEAYQFISKNV